jgi:hypothetical protein
MDMYGFKAIPIKKSQGSFFAKIGKSILKSCGISKDPE